MTTLQNYFHSESVENNFRFILVICVYNKIIFHKFELVVCKRGNLCEDSI